MSVRTINADLTTQNAFKELDNTRNLHSSLINELQTTSNPLKTGHNGTVSVAPGESLELTIKNGVIQTIKVTK